MDKSLLVPSVAVLMPTFNHEKYIGQAIESVLAQTTDFDVYLYISDDCSTDQTFQVASKFSDRNRVQIKLTRTAVNIGANANGERQFLQALNSGCKYIAVLEGDDYWTDPLKLQKQVDFLEASPDYPMCFHQNLKLKDNKIVEFSDLFFDRDRKPDEILWGGILFNTILFRSNILNHEDLRGKFAQINMADVYVLTLLSRRGGAKFLPSIKPSIYRFHEGGIWNPMSVKEKVEKRIANYLQFDKVPLQHRRTYYFVIMNFCLDLAVICVKRGQVASAIKAYLKAARFSMKSSTGLQWFFLFHVKARYRRYIIKKLKTNNR